MHTRLIIGKEGDTTLSKSSLDATFDCQEMQHLKNTCASSCCLCYARDSYFLFLIIFIFVKKLNYFLFKLINIFKSF